MTTPTIIGLYAGMPRTITNASGTFTSGIVKSPVTGAFLSVNGFVGDGVANEKFHGGTERAVCVYSYEHYPLWEKERGAPLERPGFGENLLVAGMLEKNVCIGDIYRLGEAVVQVSQSRNPCYTISRRNEFDPMLARVIETGFTGYFFRVLQEGEVRTDSRIELVEKHPKGISVFETNRVLFRDLSNAPAVAELLEHDALAEAWKDTLRRRAARQAQQSP
ncbi:MOSC domain-containing protein [Paenibacillus thermotolerans]|uniref:MOSC domain-containing protein n=1 Tax=Paenibacillus thermotolerans TaxID=3027807 RepID=UPI002367E93D|nr:MULTISPECIES: MOSC domain-containing protein [unclassified Paenibacillus]